MNYLFLKNIIESILANFHCPECGLTPPENALEIKTITDKGVDISFLCPKCQSKALMKAELGQTKLSSDFMNSETGKNFLQELTMHQKIIFPKPQNKGISSDEIEKIEEKLSKNTTINDLINGD